MIESPVLQRFLEEHLAKQMQESIQSVLEARFGALPPDFIALLESVASAADEERLRGLLKRAATCTDLEAFRQDLQPQQAE